MRTAWLDLAEVPDDRTDSAEVCIVGAGAAGLYLARVLAERGVSVILVEAGPVRPTSSDAMGFVADFGGDVYPGATLGRFFGLGGSTARWGGALVPHSSHDVRDAEPTRETWRHVVAVVEANTRRVLRTLGFSGEPGFSTYPEQVLGTPTAGLPGTGLTTQSALYLPFRRKNLIGLLQPARTSSGKPPRVYVNAVAKEWRIASGSHGGPQVTELLATSRNRHTLRVSARRFVIAAGAIESARCLLEIQHVGSRPVLRAGADPGGGLADHLSVPIADVPHEHAAMVARAYGPRFQGSWLRTFRFVDRQPAERRPRYFAHFIFPFESAGYTVAKEVLGAVQARRWPRVSVGELTRGCSDIARLAIARYLASRLHIPAGNPIRLQLDVEQPDNPAHRITLGSATDDYGRRIPSINWSITPDDMDLMRSTASHVLKQWSRPEAGLPALVPRTVGDDQAKPYDAYHPVGTCRMGNDRTAVVDHHLRVWGVENLWVVSTGVLPGAGTANPTFTMLCLAHQLAESIAAAPRDYAPHVTKGD